MPDEVFGITVTGLDQTLAALDNLPKNIVALGFAKALEAGGMVIQREVDKRTPIQLKASGGQLIVEGGALKAALTHKIEIDSQLRGGSFIIGWGNQAYKVPWVEYGHRMIGHKPKKLDLGTVPAHPFARPAIEFSYERAIEVFADTLAGIVADPDKLARGLAAAPAGEW